MYVGNIKQWEREIPGLPDNMMGWIEKLSLLDHASLTTGKHDLGNDNFMNIDETVTELASQRRLEGHHLYADIQMVLAGDETIGYQPMCNVGKPVESNENNDCYFFDGAVQDDVAIHMTPGMFAIFFPGDAHRPLCATDGKCGAVRKIIMKIYLG